MKNKATKQAIFQSFLFNTVFLSIFIIVGVYYVLPAYGSIIEKSSELSNLSSKYFKLKESGLSFGDFNSLHQSLGKKKNLDKDVFLSNVLRDFSKDDYESYFKSTDGGVYGDFLQSQIKAVKIKKEELEETGINDDIKDILPYYTADSSLSDDSLTDFKFINYIEYLLDAFNLTTKDKIGMGELFIEESFGGGAKGKAIEGSPLDGKIYNGDLSLSLVGKKRNIINFIYYIENVGKIEIVDGKVSIKEEDKELILNDESGLEKRNDFSDIGKYFRGDKSIYNNLLMEVEALSFAEYLDSSDLPTPDKYSLMRLAKEKQGDEKFEVSVTLKFYVKGLPTYKIEEFIGSVYKKHSQLLKISKGGLEYIGKNRSELTGSHSISAINSLQKVNKYLGEVQKEMDRIKVLLGKREDMGNIYNQSLEFQKVFTMIGKQLDTDIKAVSVELHEKYKDILNN